MNEIKPFRYGIKWKQTAKGDWICEQISIKADTPEELKEAQDKAIEVMQYGRNKGF